MKIGLVVHAVGLPTELERIQESFKALGNATRDVIPCWITDADYHEADMAKFNPAAAKNVGLRRLIPECDGVVCIDADYIIPPGLFELLAEPALQAFHVWARRRDCSADEAKRRAWADWLNLPVFPDCWGSCNYMTSENWLKVGGWDERTYGWGGDDDVLHIRVGQVDIERRKIDMLPLMHIAHGLRQWGGVNARGKENVKWASVPQPNYLAEGKDA